MASFILSCVMGSNRIIILLLLLRDKILDLRLLGKDRIYLTADEGETEQHGRQIVSICEAMDAFSTEEFPT